ncbi:GNAT family N-acetyltransferase [Paucibacter sp. B2R-40]|uniref:GNAT family N-acetyltransferase n=1 Tax=Paucibacter sp. B2R-40 TaxID=2893554 RepID=UPI0021E4702C|nr:GNAT family N-acetyltransferase [Paucibacter sp. B2R-40]MCV2355474.1 GNAT family N-acetyltransferase [Paucibacter sp. B2R-40]
MSEIKRRSFKKLIHHYTRLLFGKLPTDFRYPLYRRMVDFDPVPDMRLELKIAETKEELAGCFSILHDAYVSSGFMQPHPSGMRITKYHALPTTTTICAKYDGKIVGTISMIREGVFGFPLQSVFDLTKVRAKGGRIAEISALAVHPDFRKTGGAIFFPLMKFMREYCVNFFETRHLVIAVNPNKIEFYESILYFTRLQESAVEEYDFANGAPAVGATLDLRELPGFLQQGFKGRPKRKNLYGYFYEIIFKNIKWPERKYHITNDPVMTPELLNYFFNTESSVFDDLDDRSKTLLWSIYDLAEYRGILPMLKGSVDHGHPLRKHQRYSIRCPGSLTIVVAGERRNFVIEVIEISISGFQAECKLQLPLEIDGLAEIDLGLLERSTVKVRSVRARESEAGIFYGFKVNESDSTWRQCVASLEVGITTGDLR